LPFKFSIDYWSSTPI